MNELFTSLGLSDNEAKIYQTLLKHEDLTATELSEKASETRTNTYSLLDKLIDMEVVETDESSPVRRYRAANPEKLRELLDDKKNFIAQTEAQLESVLPDLQSIYNLAQNKPGVFYYEGVEGFKKLLEDMALAKSDIWLLPSQMPPKNSQIDLILDRGVAKRRARGIKTKILLPEEAKEWKTLDRFRARNFEIRFIGEPVNAEIISYDDKIAFTSYEPKLINTIITDKALAISMQMMFYELWCRAEKVL